MARVQEQVDLAALLAGELVDRRRGEARLPQGLHLLGFHAQAGVAQLAGEPVALRDELRRLDCVEAVELGFEVVYGSSSVRMNRG